MPVLLADAETASELDLKKVGADFYVRHPSTRTLLWSLRALEWPRSLVFEARDFWSLVFEIRAKKQIEWPSGEPLIVVHWSAFDRLLIEREPVVTAFPVQWIDLQAVSLSYGGPAELGAAATFWTGLEMKDDGKHLIARFCKPQKDGSWITPQDDPVRWERFRSYAGQDTNVMVPLWELFVHLAEPDNGGHRWSEHRPAWEAVQRMNARGVPVDRAAAERATALLQAAEGRLSEECQAVYGILPSQTEKVRARLGLPDVRKETLEEALAAGGIRTEFRRLAEIRLETAGAARKKLGPMLATTTEADPRFRGGHIYHGAWTRRLTARLLQTQNMVRAKSDPAFFEGLHREAGPDFFAAVRQNIRGFVAAEPGNVLVAADFSQIELRVGAWLAGETWKLDELARGEDVYRSTAADLFRVPPDAVKKPSRERDLGKVTDLSCIFQVGGPRLAAAARAKPYSIDISDEEGDRIVASWRARHPAFVASWEEMRDAFIELGRGLEQDCWVLGGRVRMQRFPTHIRVTRPSGFAQYFWQPQILEGQWPNGGARWELAYVGLDQAGRPALQRTYGGNLFQGVVQGTAADLMLDALIRCEERGFHPVMSVHDELVCEQGDDGESYVGLLCEVVSERPAWAAGIPVEAEGWQGPRFTK